MSLVLLSMALTLATAAGDPVPVGTRAASTDQQWDINSVPTRVREWTLDLDLAQSQDFYRQLLGIHHVELHSPQGLILAAPRDGHFVTAELMRAGTHRTRIRISEAKIAAAAVSEPRMIPLPVNSKVLSRVSGANGDGRAQMVTARTSEGFLSTVNHFNQAFARNGLKLIEHHPVRQADQRSEVMSFAGVGHRVELVLTADATHTWISAISSDVRQ